jgi:hypothetical protein
LRASLCRERARLFKQLPPKPSARRAGRPNKDEKGSDAKTLAALSAHHGYQMDGSVTNREPAQNLQLKEKYGLANNALARFLKRKLGKDAHKQYETACRNGTIGVWLRSWNGDFTPRQAQLRDEDGAKPRQSRRGLGDDDD